MAKVYGGGKAPGDRVFLPVERSIYRVCGVDPSSEQRWTDYAFSLLAFSFVSVLVLYAQLRLQGPCRSTRPTRPASPPALSFNTAVSFLTNTNWQNYSGESTMSHLTQMAGLAVHNFVSAAAGAAVAVALIRGLVAPAHAHARQLLGRPRARHDPRPPAARVRVRARAREPGRGPELPRRQDGHDGRGRRRRRSPAARSRARRRSRRSARTAAAPYNANSVAPVREPEPDHEHPRDLAAARDPVRASRGCSGRWPAT